MNDERELNATNGKSEFDVYESLNQSDFRLPKIVGFRQHLDSNSDTSLLVTESTRMQSCLLLGSECSDAVG